MDLWTKMHAKQLLPSIAVMIILAIVLKVFIGKKSEKIRMIPFQIISVILVILEVIKQVLSIKRGYDLYHIPLHVCSLFMIFYPLMAFYKGKLSKYINGFATALTGALFILMIVYPNLIYSAGNIKNYFNSFFDFHTVTMHTIAMFGFFLIVFLDLYKFDVKKDIVYYLIILLVYCAVAGTLAQVIQTNFNNFLECNVPPIENLRVSVIDAIGGVGQVLYVIIVSIVDSIVFTIAYFLIFGANKLVKKLIK
ncbi:MAG: hypothetical protein E7342_04330 [Clostridiales bacterium]|nr:hypothetical protein [Clostridiales bacterium]